MTQVAEPETDVLGDLFWQDELTEAMWWLASERHMPHADIASLQGVLWSGAAVDAQRLRRLVEAGLVEPASPAAYVLTHRGRARGAALLGREARESISPEKVCGSARDASASCCGPNAAEGDCGCCGGGRDAGLAAV